MKIALLAAVLLSVMGCSEAREMRACGEMCGAVGVKEFNHHEELFFPTHECVCNQRQGSADGGARR